MSSVPEQLPSELTDEQYARWKNLFEQRTGIASLQQKPVLQKSLSQRMHELGYSEYDAYFQWLDQAPEGRVEWAQLVDRISVKETSFFRDPKSFQVVRNYLAEHLAITGSQPVVNLWSVGCSTGEEAYSLAMVASDVIDYLAGDTLFGVMATDISRSALQTARQGHYGQRKLETIPLAIRNKHVQINAQGDGEIEPGLKQRVCFVQGNIVDLGEHPRMHMDVIYCQNVLVYFQRERQYQVLDNLVEHLNPGGLLVLSPAEASGWQHPQLQRYPDDMALAYQKRQSIN